MQDLGEIFAGALGQASAESMLGMLADMQREIDLLSAEIEMWKDLVGGSRPAKGRSPAVWRFRAVRWEWVDVRSVVGTPPAPMAIRALRVHVPLEDQADGPGYWDLTSKRVQEALLPLLPGIAAGGSWVTVRHNGRGPTSTYSVTIAPA